MGRNGGGQGPGRLESRFRNEVVCSLGKPMGLMSIGT